MSNHVCSFACASACNAASVPFTIASWIAWTLGTGTGGGGCGAAGPEAGASGSPTPFVVPAETIKAGGAAARGEMTPLGGGWGIGGRGVVRTTEGARGMG